MKTFNVFRVASDGQPRSSAGTVSLDDDGQLQVVGLPDGSDLSKAIADLNGREKLFIKLPPEPEDEKFSINKVGVTRGEERFLEALKDNLRRWYGLEIESA